MAETRGRPVAVLGPIDFEGPAVEREAKFLENNNHHPVDLKQWYANTLEQKSDMAKAEAKLFSDLDN